MVDAIQSPGRDGLMRSKSNEIADAIESAHALVLLVGTGGAESLHRQPCGGSMTASHVPMVCPSSSTTRAEYALAVSVSE